VALEILVKFYIQYTQIINCATKKLATQNNDKVGENLFPFTEVYFSCAIYRNHRMKAAIYFSIGIYFAEVSYYL